MTFKSGKFGRATVGAGSGTELPIVSWSAGMAVDHVEFRNSKTGSFTVVDPTFFPPVPIQIVIDRDLDNNPFADPPNLTVGATLTNVKLYENGGSGGTPSGDPFTFTSALVKGTPVEVVIDGKIGIQVSLLSSGPYTYPGGKNPSTNLV
jgi:hypothetical protein